MTVLRRRSGVGGSPSAPAPFPVGVRRATRAAAFFPFDRASLLFRQFPTLPYAPLSLYLRFPLSSHTFARVHNAGYKSTLHDRRTLSKFSNVSECVHGSLIFISLRSFDLNFEKNIFQPYIISLPVAYYHLLKFHEFGRSCCSLTHFSGIFILELNFPSSLFLSFGFFLRITSNT